MMGNFSFLASRWNLLSDLGEMSERNVYVDPNTSLIKLRMFGETLTKYMSALEELEESRTITQVDRLNQLQNEDLLTDEIVEMLHTLRKIGNKAAHEAGYGSTTEALACTQLAFRLAVWFMQVYGDWDFPTPDYVQPVRQEIIGNQEQLEQLARSYDEKVERLQQELEAVREQQTTISTEVKNTRKTRSKQAGSAFALSEAETRLIIDEKLRQAGIWSTSRSNRPKDWLYLGLSSEYTSRLFNPEKMLSLAMRRRPVSTPFSRWLLSLRAPLSMFRINPMMEM